MKNVLAFATLLAFSAVSPAQNIRFVRASASPDGANGFSWETAFPDLNDALATAQYGDEIWICGGTYRPTAGTDRNQSFTLPNGVRLYGGFAGTELNRFERDWATHPTILSGDIGVPGETADNAYCILYATQCDTTTTVDGLVFEYGNANNPDDVNVFSHERTQSGAAIYLRGQGGGKFAYLTLANCIFRNNHSDYYGSVYANGRDSGRSALRVSNCQFYQNTAGYAGGGLVVENYYGPQFPTTIQQSSFHDNIAQVHGGAMYLVHHGDLLVKDCSFLHDSIYYSAGGAIGIKGSEISNPVVFEDCIFDSNKVGNNSSVGAVMIVEVQNSNMEFDFRRCIFKNNQGGDGIWVPSIYGSITMRFAQCIIQENNTSIFLFDQTAGSVAQFDFTNCVFYKNSGWEFVGGAGTVFNCSNNILIKNDNSTPLFNVPSGLHIDHCLVSTPDCAALGANITCGPGMLFGLDPQFADPAHSDFHLLPCSAALDAGNDTTALALGLSKDFDGQPRFADAAVDLGPYELNRYLTPTSQQPASCADLSDGAVTFATNACAPYSLSWVNDAGQSGSNTTGLEAGTYHFLLTDPTGFTDSATVVVSSPPPLVVYTSVLPASGPLNPDGALVIDSAFGGTPPYPWTNGEPLNGFSNLLPGTYTTTLTDSWGCAQVFVFEVTFVSGTIAAAEASPVQLSPNPTLSGAAARLLFEPGKIAGLELSDAMGRILRSWDNPGGAQIEVPADFPAGVYFFDIRDQKGRTTALRWLIQ